MQVFKGQLEEPAIMTPHWDQLPRYTERWRRLAAEHGHYMTTINTDTCETGMDQGQSFWRSMTWSTRITEPKKKKKSRPAKRTWIWDKWNREGNGCGVALPPPKGGKKQWRFSFFRFLRFLLQMSLVVQQKDLPILSVDDTFWLYRSHFHLNHILKIKSKSKKYIR